DYYCQSYDSSLSVLF
nr:immunoglobulin light chain junction region [Macaca mulatta]MOV96205.1 immunoglobulin light chain junction region [Macaca mulatta]MOV99861.1 immunoglobulin light chain junction region [Macaca mulatta]MOW02431.1 immunoglobulin light chain junction region [Macaca mulatta]MOW02616.1 immunoglobulin light chain junction region [Macaca mulatta]